MANILDQKEKMLPLVLTLFSIICSSSTWYMFQAHALVRWRILGVNYALLEEAELTHLLENLFETQLMFCRIFSFLSVIFLALAFKYKPGWLFIIALPLSIGAFSITVHA